MILNKQGTGMRFDGKLFTVGGAVLANGQSEYEGLRGVVTELRDGNDRETGNDTVDIHCCFTAPQDESTVRVLEQRFSRLYGVPKRLEELALDYVIMSSDMLEVLPC